MTDGKAALRSKVKHPIDWVEIHRCLESTRQAVNRTTLTAAEKNKLLKARAAALAREPADTAKSGEMLLVVEFQLAHERYGIELSRVREVCHLRNLTPLPHTPHFIRGIINVRGQILSVLDLKHFFDLPARGLANLNRVIIIQDDTLELGILADVILGVVSIPLREIQPALPTLTGVRMEYLKGVTGESMVLLDAQKILSDSRITIHQEA